MSSVAEAYTIHNEDFIITTANSTERGGFEPPLSCPKTDFESAAFNHSATSPEVWSLFILKRFVHFTVEVPRFL